MIKRDVPVPQVAVVTPPTPRSAPEASATKKSAGGARGGPNGPDPDGRELSGCTTRRGVH